MNKKRSSCLTCLKEYGHADLLSEQEAILHRENNVSHHVIVNPDSDAEREDDNGD